MRENGTARSGFNTDRMLMSGEHHTETGWKNPSFIPSFLFFVMRPLIWSEPCVCVCVLQFSLERPMTTWSSPSVTSMTDGSPDLSVLIRTCLNARFSFKQAGWLWTRSYANQISAIFCFSNIYFYIWWRHWEMTNKYFPEFVGPQICRLGFLPLG